MGTFEISTTAYSAEFIIKNQKAPQEISESSTVYIDGKPVAHFTLNDTTKEISKTITIPDITQSVSYDLCGRITIRNAAGQPETHEINSKGILYSPQSKTFLAIVTADFKYYYLANPEDPNGHKVLEGHSNICLSPSV
ncbi:hypothetical protein [Entomobacter blattae]|nr:hypothetical protein [Entomobacter blattae]